MFTYYRFNTTRIALAALAFAGVIFAPWWFVVVAVFLLCLRFRAWEVVLVGMCMDLYWLPGSVFSMSWHTLPWGTIIAIVLLFGLEPVRRQLLIGPEIL